jgi:pyridoxine 5-phosphate synthase
MTTLSVNVDHVATLRQARIVDLRQAVTAKLNLEMATTDEMIDLALELRPDQVTLVPERPEEITTEGGLDLLHQGERTLEVATQLTEHGIAVSVFLDPDPDQVGWLIARASGSVAGFEINTDRYSTLGTRGSSPELTKIRDIATQGASGGLEVYAGHGLTTDNVGAIAAIDPVEELNIGHYLISRAVLVGLRQAVAEMLQAINQADSPG